MTAACPLCAEGRARIPRGSTFVHLGDVPSIIVSCGEQPGYDPEAFNRAVDAVVDGIKPWKPRTATEATLLHPGPDPRFQNMTDAQRVQYIELLKAKTKQVQAYMMTNVSLYSPPVDVVKPGEPDYCDESEYCECLSCDSKREYAAPFAYSYSPCPVCTRIVLPGDEISGQMLGRPVHARCMAEYTADLDDYDDRTGER